MDSPVTIKDNLEVTGVSRSGRVRKKSSKLMDFQSPDEIESSKLKRTTLSKTLNNLSGNMKFHESPLDSQQQTVKDNSDEDEMDLDISNEHIDESVGSSEDFSENNDDDIDDRLCIDTTVRKSAYMMEKSTKKKVMKNGKVILSKQQRKDKGKSRITAYMIWAKDARQEMLNSNPDLDFSTVARRLGEMWANVPSSEKYVWKRRAKRTSMEMKQKEKQGVLSKITKPPKLTTFLNRQTTPRQKKMTTQSYERKTMKANAISLKQENINQNSINKNNSMLTSSTLSPTTPTVSPITIATTAITTPQLLPSSSASPQSCTSTITTAVHVPKMCDIEPVDVAAHLKLLGDSLTIIGERLKEHEGQITVSGSLSVLLDSLLCSLGPLICLTHCIPDFSHNVTHLRTTMSNTLDNIAYVMPGL